LAYDERCLGEKHWVGVILRDLPLNAREDGIRNKLSKPDTSELERINQITRDSRDESLASHKSIQDEPHYKILNINGPEVVRNQMCCVVEVEDIEDAEKMCLIWNKHQIDRNQWLKVHIHPYSYRLRPKDKLSIHAIFKSKYNEELGEQRKQKFLSEKLKTQS
jgi:hypothetical protein